MIIFSVRKFFCLSFFDVEGQNMIFYSDILNGRSTLPESTRFSKVNKFIPQTILKTLADFRFKLWQKVICIFWPITTGSKRVEQRKSGLYLCVCWGAGHWEIGGKWNKMAWKIIDSSQILYLSTTSLTAPRAKVQREGES